MRRTRIAWGVSLVALGVGLLTASQAALNRARGDELDRRERWCEAQSRRNDLARVANERAEWALLGQQDPSPPAQPGKGVP